MNATTELTALSWEENLRLDAHEEIINKGLKILAEVGWT